MQQISSHKITKTLTPSPVILFTAEITLERLALFLCLNQFVSFKIVFNRTRLLYYIMFVISLCIVAWCKTSSLRCFPHSVREGLTTDQGFAVCLNTVVETHIAKSSQDVGNTRKSSSSIHNAVFMEILQYIFTYRIAQCVPFILF